MLPRKSPEQAQGSAAQPLEPPEADRPSVGDSLQGAAVLIVDDHPVVRQGLAQFINRERDLHVCGQAGDAHNALSAIDDLHPDVVIVDLALKDRPGIDLIKDIEVRHPGLPILVLSMHDEGLWAERCLRAGARGYIMKEEGTDLVVAALRRVLAGEIWVSNAIGSRLLHRLSKTASTGEVSPLSALSDRELVIFRMIGLGLSTRDIAGRLSLSMKTVDTYRDRIREKLDLKNGPELLRYAIIATLDDG